MKRNLLFLVIALLLSITGCGSGGGNGDDPIIPPPPPPPPKKSVEILTINPSAAAPGRMIRIDCRGIDETSENVFIIFTGYNHTPVSHGNGYVYFYTPAVNPGVYGLILSADGKESDPSGFTVNDIPNQPYTQVEFSKIVSKGLNEVLDLERAIFDDIKSGMGLFTDDEIMSIEDAFLMIENICDSLEDDIKHMSAQDARLLQCLLNETDVLQLLSSFRSGAAERYSAYFGDEDFFNHETLFIADQISAMITNVQTILDIGILAAAIPTMGESLVVGASIGNIKFVFKMIDFMLDSVLPTDLCMTESGMLYPFVIEDLSDIYTNEYLEPGFRGYFRCQDEFIHRLISLEVDALFSMFGSPISIPESTKESLISMTKTSLIKAGVNLGEELLGEAFKEVDGLLFDRKEVMLNASIFNISYSYLLLEIFPDFTFSCVLKLLEISGMMPTGDIPVKVTDPDVLVYYLSSGKLYGRQEGKAYVYLRGYSMVPESFLYLWKLETQKWARSANWEVNVLHKGNGNQTFSDGSLQPINGSGVVGTVDIEPNFGEKGTDITITVSFSSGGDLVNKIDVYSFGLNGDWENPLEETAVNLHNISENEWHDDNLFWNTNYPLVVRFYAITFGNEAVAVGDVDKDGGGPAIDWQNDGID